MARAIARRFDADILKIEAAAYSLDFGGWADAVYDSWNKLPAIIDPQTVPMGHYRLVFLGAPVWWYRPAPPLWTFTDKSDSTGKAVVLFNTYNSRFKFEEIEAFADLVKRRGGRLVDHAHVRRGRIYEQLGDDELMGEIGRLLDTRADTWRQAS